MKKIFISLSVFLLSAGRVIASDVPGVQTAIPITPVGTGSCSASYYTYQQPVKSGSPTLADLFDGKAHFQSAVESQEITLVGHPRIDHNKMSILYNPDNKKYYAFTRDYIGYTGDPNTHYNINIFVSDDGVTFNKIGPIFSQSAVQNAGSVLGLYDAHVSIDYSVCPTRYIMALECGGALCSSVSTNPYDPSSWSNPVRVISYDTTNQKSASTGVFLIDGTRKYTSWTVVDDKNQNTYSQGIAINDYSANMGLSTIGNTLLPAEKYPCTSAWDCNNRDKQDWKKEGNYYYLIYNGANYYRCGGDWGIGIARSTDPLSGYNLPGTGKILDSEDKTTCGIEYPVVNNIGGEIYMYYGYNRKDTAAGNTLLLNLRSKLIWNAGVTPPVETPAPIPGDLNNSGHVDIFDYNILVSNFGHPYTIFDYNDLVSNFGK